MNLVFAQLYLESVAPSDQSITDFHVAIRHVILLNLLEHIDVVLCHPASVGHADEPVVILWEERGLRKPHCSTSPLTWTRLVTWSWSRGRPTRPAASRGRWRATWIMRLLRVSTASPLDHVESAWRRPRICIYSLLPISWIVRSRTCVFQLSIVRGSCTLFVLQNPNRRIRVVEGLCLSVCVCFHFLCRMSRFLRRL